MCIHVCTRNQRRSQPPTETTLPRRAGPVSVLLWVSGVYDARMPIATPGGKILGMNLVYALVVILIVLMFLMMVGALHISV